MQQQMASVYLATTVSVMVIGQIYSQKDGDNWLVQFTLHFLCKRKATKDVKVSCIWSWFKQTQPGTSTFIYVTINWTQSYSVPLILSFS